MEGRQRAHRRCDIPGLVALAATRALAVGAAGAWATLRPPRARRDRTAGATVRRPSSQELLSLILMIATIVVVLLVVARLGLLR